MALSSAMNPDLVQTKLDRLFFSEFNLKPGPEFGDVMDESIFRQDNANNAAVVTEVMAGTDLWNQRSEFEDVNEETPLAADLRTNKVVSYSNSIPVSKRFIDDEEWGAVAEQVRDMANMAKITDRNNGFDIYRGAFTTTLTNNGTALVSDTQSNINGDVIDNKLTAKLTEASLNDAIIALMAQKNQKGVSVGQEAACLLVPPALYKTAVEITDSQLRSATSDNDLNVYSSRYGITVKQNNYLGANVNGSDSAWFLLAKNHRIYRYEREAVSTNFLPWENSRNMTAYYTGEFRNVYAAATYEGLIGSDGTV